MNFRTKTNNLLMLFRCGINFLHRGRSVNLPKIINKILILQTTPNFGDLVCTTPVFRAVKKTYPNSKLIVVGRNRGKEVLRANPYIDEFWGYENSPFELFKKIKDEKIDFACTINPGTSLLAFLYLAKIPFISAPAFKRKANSYAGSYNLLKKLVHQTSFSPGIFIPRQYLKLLEPIYVFTEDSHFDLYYTPEAEKKIEQILEKENINPKTDLLVAVAPGGSTEIRWWGRDKYAKLADYLYKKYSAKIFLMGAGLDRRPIAEMIGFMDKETKYVNFLNQSLDEFKAFLSKASLIIGNDSGPMTAAKAFKVPMMVFIGPTDETEYQLSHGPLNRIIKSKDRSIPVTTSLNWVNYDAEEARRQMDSIALEEAIAEADTIIGNIKNLSLGKNKIDMVPISPGELLDKIAILEVKAGKISNPEQLAHVNKELSFLREVSRKNIPNSGELEKFNEELRAASIRGWDIENGKRECELRQDFGPEFIELARAAFKNNDQRAAIKKQINLLLNSEIVEEKSYV